MKDLQEMCFGSFEGRNFIEMEHDPDYLAWVNANCESPCPDGETKAVFGGRWLDEGSICFTLTDSFHHFRRVLHISFFAPGAIVSAIEFATV